MRWKQRKSPSVRPRVKCDRCGRDVAESPMFGSRKHKCRHGQPCAMKNYPEDKGPRCSYCNGSANMLVDAEKAVETEAAI